MKLFAFFAIDKENLYRNGIVKILGGSRLFWAIMRGIYRFIIIYIFSDFVEIIINVLVRHDICRQTQFPNSNST